MTVYVGVLMAIAGAFQLVRGYRAETGGRLFWPMFLGALCLAAAASVFFNPPPRPRSPALAAGVIFLVTRCRQSSFDTLGALFGVDLMVAGLSWLTFAFAARAAPAAN